MFQRVETGWRLAKQSWQVLKLDKELLIFPLMSGIACILVLVSFLAPLWGTGFLDPFLEEELNPGGVDTYHQVVGAVVLFAYYFVNYFVIIFFNSALISCAIIRFKGGNPNLGDGFAAATSRLPQIAGWAAVAATVGVILRIIESRSERAGEIVAGLMGMAWSIVTYFVVPIIVVERASPVTAARRSMEILKKTWGEALSANFGIGAIVTLASLLGIVPIALGAMAFSAGHVAFGVVGIAAGIGYILLVSLISSALNAILLGALYLYAAEGTVPAHFDNEMFREAFAHK